jgi:hydroxypyruvate isomerase
VVAARFDVNLSILFTELPLLERPAAARAAGFDAVEFWWPWPVAVPSDAEIDRFVDAVAEAEVALVGLNFFAGDMPGGDRGVLSWPERSSEFRDNVDVALGVGERLGCRAFNALYGNRRPDADPEAQDELATENLVLAARAAQRIGGTVLVEPVSGAAEYPLLRAVDALSVIDRVRRAGEVDNVRLLLDVYHLVVNGDDVDAAIDRASGLIGHVQIADAPGRHEPGTGELDLDRYLDRIHATGYDGWVGLEYKPSGSSADSLAWLDRAARSAPASR